MKPGDQPITEPRIRSQKPGKQLGNRTKTDCNEGQSKGTGKRHKCQRCVRRGSGLMAQEYAQWPRGVAGLNEGAKTTCFCCSKYSKVFTRGDHAAFWLPPNSTLPGAASHFSAIESLTGPECVCLWPRAVLSRRLLGCNHC